jgi:hypothetical protein
MKIKFVLLIMLLFLIVPLSPQATTELSTPSEVFDFLKVAYKAQVSLSEKVRSKKEIENVLDPYFSNDFQAAFWKENIHEEDGKYVTYGTDFAQYYIPYYQFSNRTKVVITSEEIYVFEFFPARTEGPVGYKSHYEGLYLKKIDRSWKVDKYLFDQIPEDIIKRAEVFKK